MRLEPIAKPPTLLGRLLDAAVRSALGRSITPSQVVYNRVPAAWRIALAFQLFERFGAKLPEELRLLVTTRIAQINGCAFCQDIKRASAIRARLGVAKFDALEDWSTSSVFSARERAALAFVEEATRAMRVGDATFALVASRFDEREIAELALLNAIENFYNRMNLALGIDTSDGLEALAREARGEQAMRATGFRTFILSVVLLFGCASPSPTSVRPEPAAPVEARLDDTVRHVVRSRLVDQTFVIDVWQPPGVPGPLPVVYVLDGNTMFGMTYQMILSMFFAGDVPPVLVVGVGYEVESAFEVVALRSRDLLPTPEADFESEMAAMGFPVPQDFETGGADAFLRFIEEELKPFVAARYPVNPKDETLVGYSYGGTFAFHTLLSSTESFERYVIGSPVLGRDAGELIADEERHAAAGRTLEARVFLSAGEYEIENGIREPVEEMIATLRSRSYPGLVLETHVFPEETHQSGIAPTVSRGLRAVFGTWPR